MQRDALEEESRIQYAPARAGLKVQEFYFALEGKSAHCDEVLWGKPFDLVFRYDDLLVYPLRVLKGNKLLWLSRNKNQLRIEVDPMGLALRDGVPVRIVNFKNGKIVGKPPRFRLMAPTKSSDTEPERRGVHITFTIDQAPIYSFFLDIRLVEQLSTAPCTSPPLDLDLESLKDCKPVPRNASLYTWTHGSTWQVRWCIGGMESKPELVAEINNSSLAEEYKKIISDLSKIVQDKVWSRLIIISHS